LLPVLKDKHDEGEIRKSVLDLLGMVNAVDTQQNTDKLFENAATALDVVSGAKLTMPSGVGTYSWIILTYGATIAGAKSGSMGAGLTVNGTASANCTVLVRRIL
jgi:hypothetical protein